MPPIIRALILEDRPDDAELMLLELERSGLEVDWKRVEREDDYLAELDIDYDIILADYSMPQFTALRALEILQQQELDIPFIIVTGSIGEEVAVECMRLGATDYLLKDRMSRLAPAVESALREKALRQGKQVAQQALQESEDRYRTLFETMSQAVVYHNVEGGIIAANPAAEQILGLSLAEMQGRASVDPRWRTIQEDGSEFPGEEHPAIRALRTGHVFKNVIMGVFSPAIDDYRWISIDAIPQFHDGETLPYQVYTVFTDLTERRQREEEHRQADFLRVELQKEKELRELKSRFVSMVSHEFRNPLASIQLAASTLQRYLDKLDSAQREAKLENIFAQVDHMVKLMEDVLVIGHGESDVANFQPVEQDVEKFCQIIFTEVQQTMGNKHRFEFLSNGGCMQAVVDGKLMRPIISNLISNAIKYSAEGTKVCLEVLSDDHHITIRVIDRGIGIPEEDQKRLFEAFHRAGNVGKIQGTGLGLAIAKQSVELHGGTIQVESAVGVGSTFVVTIPKVQEEKGLSL